MGIDVPDPLLGVPAQSCKQSSRKPRPGRDPPPSVFDMATGIVSLYGLPSNPVPVATPAPASTLPPRAAQLIDAGERRGKCRPRVEAPVSDVLNISSPLKLEGLFLLN